MNTLQELHPDDAGLTLLSSAPLTKLNLPSPKARWTAHRKAAVAAAIIKGELTNKEAMQRYPGLTSDELNDWLVRYAQSNSSADLRLIASLRNRPGQIQRRKK